MKTKRTKRKTEKRSTFSNPAQWLVNWATGGGTGYSGVSVNEDSALKSSTVYACVSAIATDVAKLPLHFYRRGKTGVDEKLDDGPAAQLLRLQPNPLMTAFDLRSVLTAHVLTWGNGYALIERNMIGTPIGLWPLRPDRVTVYRYGPYRLVYKVQFQPDDGREMQSIEYDQEDILHIPGLGFDGLVGYDVITYARDSIGGAIAAERHGSTFFGNGARPGGVLEHPGQLSPDAQKRLRETWEATHGGAANANKTAILEEGLKYHEITLAPEASQFIETRQFSVSDICRWFRMPPRKVGDTSRAQGWSTVEASNTEYIQDTIMPWLVRWESRIDKRLLNGSNLYSKHAVEGYLRGDSQSRAAFYTSAITTGWMTRNEARALENLPPLPGLDTPLSPMNLGGPQDKKGQPAKDKDADDDDDSGDSADSDANSAADRAFRHVFLDVAGRIVRREARALARAAKVPERFIAWLDVFFDEESALVRRDLGPAVDGYAEAVCAETNVPVIVSVMRKRATEVASEMANRHCESCKAEMVELFRDTPPAEFARAVEDRVAEWIGEIPAAIVATEMPTERAMMLPLLAAK